MSLWGEYGRLPCIFEFEQVLVLPMTRSGETKHRLRKIGDLFRRRSPSGLLVILSVLTVTFIVASRVLNTDEPSHGGRSLSSWLEEFDRTPWGTNTEAALAVRAMGTNTIPFLVEDLMGRDPKWRSEARRHLWTTRRELYWMRESPAQRARTRASHALRALGPDAKPALAILIEEVREGEGQSGLPWVGIAAIAPNISNAVPTILDMLDDPRHRAQATRFLSRNPDCPEVSIPYLIRCLHDEDWWTRRYALVALERFGTNATAAELDVRQLLDDTNASVAGQAAIALESIQQE